MLLHLPIVILATLSPVAVSDSAPKLDITKECRFEGGSSETFNRCVRDENEALTELQAVWPKVTGADRSSCVDESTSGGYASYIELLTCLEMARDVAAMDRRPGDPGANSESRPAQPAASDQTTGTERDR
jgi:hypothetical protein